MRFITDFHLHSRYSRATARNMDLEDLDKWAKIKGVRVLGAGDFTHPQWFQNLKDKLEPAEPGLFKLKKTDSETRFLLTAEISCIYTKKDRVRKIHILVFSPSFEICEKINAQLSWIGNIKSDGRPILGLDSEELAKIVLNTSPECLVIPAHCMTPWFAIFGSKSGFDSIEECFGAYSKYIYALETGLSADPAMLWRIPDGRRVSLISNSDSHSPPKIGREANVFDTELSYTGIANALKEKDPKKFLFTIEFYPEEGKYHFDGHRNCNQRLSPKETKKYNGICPVCGKPITVGVLNRIEQIADKEEGFVPDGAVPFKSLVPLEEIIADVRGKSTIAKDVVKEYENLISKFGSEFNILLDASKEKMAGEVSLELIEGIIKVREGKVIKEPGYDGVYGKIRVFGTKQGVDPNKQSTLF
jgi:uncharacterized protein (TIGR00375 family)